MPSSLSIGVVGCAGRIGQRLIAELTSGAWPDVTLAGGTILPHDNTPEGASYFVTNTPEALFERADVVIDFTAPDATARHAALAAEHGVALVAATSGLNEAHEKALQDAAQHVPIVYASNTSVGVNLLMALVEQAAARLSGDTWDAEILDIHHRYKVDAPSGTSYALVDAVRTGRAQPDASLVHERHGHTGQRDEGSIGVSVQRGGDSTIENSVIFFGMGERLELTHRALDRGVFAKGAVRAAVWAAAQTEGLYSMRDVLEI